MPISDEITLLALKQNGIKGIRCNRSILRHRRWIPLSVEKAESTVAIDDSIFRAEHHLSSSPFSASYVYR